MGTKVISTLRVASKWDLYDCFAKITVKSGQFEYSWNDGILSFGLIQNQCFVGGKGLKMPVLGGKQNVYCVFLWCEAITGAIIEWNGDVFHSSVVCHRWEWLKKCHRDYPPKWHSARLQKREWGRRGGVTTSTYFRTLSRFFVCRHIVS